METENQDNDIILEVNGGVGTWQQHDGGIPAKGTSPSFLQVRIY
jgi:hypothetical protein